MFVTTKFAESTVANKDVIDICFSFLFTVWITVNIHNFHIFLSHCNSYLHEIFFYVFVVEIVYSFLEMCFNRSYFVFIIFMAVQFIFYDLGC